MKLLRVSLGKLLLFQSLILVLTISVTLSSTVLQTYTPRVRAAGAMPFVQGNHILDGQGHLLILRGAHIESTLNIAEPYVTPGAVLATQHLTSITFDLMRNTWNMNAVRIATSDSLWKAHPGEYMGTLKSVVANANLAGLYVILSLHEDLRSGLQLNESGSEMPTDLAVAYWHTVAAAFKSNPMVMFDVYNEPRIRGLTGQGLTDKDWQLWLHGGILYPGTQYSVNVRGVQDLVNAIRQAGAKQIVIVEALQNWFQTIDANGTGSNFVVDPNVVYSAHVYFQDNTRTLQDWNLKFGDVSSTNDLLTRFPIFVGEWAFTPNIYLARCNNLTPQQAIALVNSFLHYMQQNNMSWTAFAFTIKQLFLDYTHYTPTQLAIPTGAPPWTCGMPTPIVGDGYLVQQYLLSNPPG